MTLYTQDQLLKYLREHIKIPAIVRALDEGEIQYYGYFEPEGFVIQVQSRFKRTWILGVKSIGFTRYQTDLLPAIPYGNYRGGSTELYSGDFPVLCMEEWAGLRKEARHGK
jgi:hypothetical protein